MIGKIIKTEYGTYYKILDKVNMSRSISHGFGAYSSASVTEYLCKMLTSGKITTISPKLISAIFDSEFEALKDKNK